jgi:phosphoglycerate kinase
MYAEDLQRYKLVNLGRQLKGPTLVRVDINLPASHERIEEDALRMRVYGHVLEMYSEYSGLVVMSHQGRKGDEDFTSLSPHMRSLRKLLPRDVDVDFVPHENVFSRETKDRIRGMKRRQILLLDNMRYFDEEKKWDPRRSTYTPFFKGLIRTCVNDSMPTWHREESSMMCLPSIAPTYIGLRSAYELRILQSVVRDSKRKALVIGGAKLQKVSDLSKIALSGVDIYSGGLVGQLLARAAGRDLGEANNKFLEGIFKDTEYEDAKALNALRSAIGEPLVRYPVDFVVEENGSRENVAIEDLPSRAGIIKDIGEETTESYADSLQESPTRVRAGPLGVYEDNFQNGLELTKRISGDGLIFLGGDTSQELNEGGLLGHIEDAGGSICVSGGSFLHGWAGGAYPSVDLLIGSQGPSSEDASFNTQLQS